MPVLRQSLVGALTAAALALCPMAAAADAFASPAAQTASAAAHAKPGKHGKHQPRPKRDKLAGDRRATTRVLIKQLAAVHRMIKQANGEEFAHAPELVAALKADVAAIKRLTGRVADAPSKNSLRSLRNKAASARGVAVLQSRAVERADEFADAAEDERGTLADLLVELEAMAADLLDVSDLQDLLADVGINLDDVDAALEEAVDTVVDVAPDAPKRALRRAARAVQAALGDAASAAASAHDAITSVQVDLGLADPGDEDVEPEPGDDD